jgi:hypothetical protein
MSLSSTNDGRLFRLCCGTVEYFGVLLVTAYWLLLFTGSNWGDKFHYHYLFDVSIPVMIVIGVSGVLAWGRYRRHALVHLAVLLAWGVWAAVPRL